MPIATFHIKIVKPLYFQTNSTRFSYQNFRNCARFP